jgi:hypothetical protein
LESLPQRPFAKDPEADCLKCLKSPDARRIVVLEFNPTDAFGDPAKRVVEIWIRLAYFLNQLFKRLAVELHLFEKIAGNVARGCAGKLGGELFQELDRETRTREMVMQIGN